MVVTFGDCRFPIVSSMGMAGPYIEIEIFPPRNDDNGMKEDKV